MFEIKLDLHEGMIKHIAIQGDFFDKKSLSPLQDAFIGKHYDKQSINSILVNHPIEDYILDAQSDAFKELLYEGVLGE